MFGFDACDCRCRLIVEVVVLTAWSVDDKVSFGCLKVWFVRGGGGVVCNV